MKQETAKQIIYENIELIKPEKRDELMADLENRTGQKINRISIGRIDFLRDTALIKIYFYEE
jgi:O-succinylbenzoate synthase